MVKWPHKFNFLPGHGYVVWRDVFEGQMRCALRAAVLEHKVAVFVTDAEAHDYCNYRNSMTAKYGTDNVRVIKHDG